MPSLFPSSDKTNTVTAHLEPQNESERVVYGAIMLLRSSRDEIKVSQNDLQTICRAAPDYTIRMIDSCSTTLLYGHGGCREEIARMVRTIEWELLGASEFIERHAIDPDEGVQFIYEGPLKRPLWFIADWRDLWWGTDEYLPINDAARANLEAMNLDPSLSQIKGVVLGTDRTAIAGAKVRISSGWTHLM